MSGYHLVWHNQHTLDAIGRAVPGRLTASMALRDQEIAGKGLVFLAIALPLYWLLSEMKPIWHFLKR